MTSKIFGYIAVPAIGAEIAVPYNVMGLLAETTGLTEDYLPKQGKKHKLNSWQKATGTQRYQANGRPFNPGQAVKDQFYKELGVEPIFKLRVARMKKDSGSNIIKRQLVMDIFTIIPGSDISNVTDDISDMSEAEKQKAFEKATKQLGTKPVLLMEYDSNENAQKFTPTSAVDSFLMPAIVKEVEAIKDLVQHNLDHADTQAIRASVRNWLLSSSAVQVMSSGSYFVPNVPEDKEDGEVKRESTVSRLLALREFMKALAPYKVKRYKSNGAEIVDRDPCLTVSQAFEDEDDILTEGNKAAIADFACDDIKSRINKVLGDLRPVIKGERKGGYLVNTTKSCEAELIGICRVVEDLKEGFGSELKQLEDAILTINTQLGEANKLKRKAEKEKAKKAKK